MSNKKSYAWRWVAFALASLAVWGLVFFWAAQPSSEQQLDFWIGFPTGLNKQVRSDILQIAKPFGIKKCNFGTYNPTDGMYQQAFAVKAQYVDVFLLNKEEVLAIVQTGELLAVLPQSDDGIYDDNGNVVALPVVGEMYVCVNKYSKKDKALLEKVVAYLTELQ